jgi:hypothetical protein
MHCRRCASRRLAETDLRIVWGGKIAGAKGWMPGILEEVAFSLLHGKPVLVLGGFGGCAGLLADFLATKDARWPERLSLAACADAERDALCSDSKRQDLEKRFQLGPYRVFGESPGRAVWKVLVAPAGRRHR